MILIPIRHSTKTPYWYNFLMWLPTEECNFSFTLCRDRILQEEYNARILSSDMLGFDSAEDALAFKIKFS